MGLAGKPYSAGPICVPGPDSCVPDQTDQSKFFLNFFFNYFYCFMALFCHLPTIFFLSATSLVQNFPHFCQALPTWQAVGGAVVVTCLHFVFVFVCFLFPFFNTLLLLLLLLLLCFLVFVWVCVFVWICWLFCSSLFAVCFLSVCLLHVFFLFVCFSFVWLAIG